MKRNDTRHPDARRELAEELAQQLSSTSGLRNARLMQALGLVARPTTSSERPDSSASAARSANAGSAGTERQSAKPMHEPRTGGATGSAAPPQARPISVWQPRWIARTDRPDGDGQDRGEWVFERPAPSPLGDQHAATPVLRAEKAPGTKRLIFLGESVAAGYLYSPHLRPAQVLEAYLQQTDAPGGGSEIWEVVDLARTNETLESLVDTALAAEQLSPDAYVLFAGNNWELLQTPHISPYFPSVRARQRYALLLQQGGLQGVLQHTRRQLQGQIEKGLDRLARLAGLRPVILTVPEVNLADWPCRQPPPWLPGKGIARWYELYEEGQKRLAEGAGAAAETLARQLLELDGGLCPSSHRLLAEALVSQGRHQEGLQACREEVATEAYPTLCFLGAPRATAHSQSLIREAARKHGFHLVDLPQLFKRADSDPDGEQLPGRRLFLDYCHLSREGIELSCRALAQALQQAGPGAGRQGEETTSNVSQLKNGEATRHDGLRLTPEQEATALFGAALHSNHRLIAGQQHAELLRHWCDCALQRSPDILHTMADLALARAPGLPAVLTAAQQRNLRSPYPLQLQHGWRWDGLDAELLRVILDLVGTRDPALRQGIESELLRHHDARNESRQLASPQYLWEPLQRFYPEVMTFADLPQRATLRCPWPRSRFALVASDDGDVRVQLVARLHRPPGSEAAASGKISWWLDGEPLEYERPEDERPEDEHAEEELLADGSPHLGQAQTAPWLGESWRRVSTRIPRQHLGRILHCLEIRWPLPGPAGQDPLSPAIERLERGLEADLHPIFGEIWELRAGPAHAPGPSDAPGRLRS